MPNLTDINSLSGPDAVANASTKNVNANKYTGVISGTDTIQQAVLGHAGIGATTGAVGTVNTDGGGIVINAHTGTATADLSIVNLSTPASGSLFNKFQIDFNIAGLDTYLNTDSATNPGWQYDPDQIAITVTFTAPDGSFPFVHAYYAIDYSRDLNPLNDPTAQPNPSYPPHLPVYLPNTGYQSTLNLGSTFNYQAPDPTYLTEIPPALTGSSTVVNLTPWHARFAPPQTGTWSYNIGININNSSGSFEFVFSAGSFIVVPSSNPGYIGAQGRNFVYNSSNDIFFPIGVNAETNGGIPSWNRLLFLFCQQTIAQLALNGGNHMRIFCTYDRFGLEANIAPYTVGNYDYGQDRAFDLDDVIAYAESNGVYLQLVLEERLYFSPILDPDDWPNNAYSPRLTSLATDALFTGSSVLYAAPLYFWTDVECIAYYQKKLRYIMARWGYSTNVFAFEFMNEVTGSFWGWTWPTIDPPSTLITNVMWMSGTSTGTVINSTSAGYLQVSAWVNTMIAYCQNECGQGSNHMFTISAPGAESNFPHDPYGAAVRDVNDFVNIMNIDFYVMHFYDTTPFTDFRINYLANRAKYLYPRKPFIIGEFGLTATNDIGNNYCGLLDTDPSSANYNKYVDNDNNVTSWMYLKSFMDGVPGGGIYDESEFHNALFASFLSGCAGTIVSWNNYSCPQCQLAYILPLVNFMQGEDLNLQNCTAITNPSPQNSAFASVGSIPFSFLNSELIFNATIYAWGFNSAGLPDTTHLEVFALQYTAGMHKNKIIGWVRNLNNWWYNLPHQWDNTSPIVSSFYPCFNAAPVVDPISKATITISGVLSNTAYTIDFYSVYPNWPLAVGEPPAPVGGIIRSIEITSVGTTLIFTVPGALVALTPVNGPCAPDYGFKIYPLY